jgi:ABC-type transport system substrate-binding protein
MMTMPSDNSTGENVGRRGLLKKSMLGIGSTALLAGCQSDGESPPESSNEGAATSSEGQWYTPDGDPFSFNILTPGTGTWTFNAQTAKQRFEDFGINVEVQITERAVYGERLQQNDFDVIMNLWGNFEQSKHPYMFFSDSYSDIRAQIGGFDATSMSVPYPIGDSSGDVRTVNVQKKIESLAEATGDKRHSLIKELAWIYNQTLIRLPLLTDIGRTWMTSDEWDLPSKSSEWMRDNAVAMTLISGNIAKSGEDKSFTVPIRMQNPDELQWNQYYVHGGTARPAEFMYERMASYGVRPDDVSADIPDRTPILANGVEDSSGKLRITIHNDRTWTDGDAVTAKDIWTQRKLEEHLGQATASMWDDVTPIDSTVIEFDIGDRDPELVSSVVLPRPVRTKRDSKFGDWVEQFEDATTDSERETIQEAVVSTKIDDPVSYGPWAFESKSNSRVMLTLWEEHPVADSFGFSSIEMPSIPQSNQRHLALENDQVDALYNSVIPKSKEDRLPDHTVRLPYRSTRGDAFVFNLNESPFDDHRVRQAFAFLINRWQNGRNAKDYLTTVKWPIGFPNREAKRYLGDSLDQYEQYGYKQSYPSEASALLKEAGYTRE